MSLRADDLKRVLADADHPLGIKELLRVAGLGPGQQTQLKQALRELVRAGEIEKQGKRFSLPGQRVAKPAERVIAPRGKGHKAAPLVEGTLHLHRDGYGFVHPAGEGENVFVPPEQARRALDNDRVQVEVVPGRDGRTAGRLVKVLDRRRQLVVGTYVDRPKGTWVEPRDEALSGTIRVPRTQMARDGDVVKVRLNVGASLLSPGEGLYGEVAGSLGKPGDPSVEVLSIAFAQGFNDEFPPEVMDEADAIGPEVSADEALGSEGNVPRRDLRAMPLVTIDGADARDFDDAVYVEEKSGGFRLVVAIADVTHYVREGTALDAEAFRRATSVYLPDRVLPMLPERLSNGICSLKPDEDRLCMVCDMVLTAAGEVNSSEIYPAVMRSAARCTYGEVQRVLSGEDVPHRNAFRPLFERAMTLARALTQMRRARGAIDFDLPENRVELDDDGKPVRMVQRERLESHRLVEECMLAANEAVARFFQEQGLPSVYRFHAEPDEEKLAAFAALARVHGFELGSHGKITSKDLNGLLGKLEGHPEQRALNQLLLRSMMQAVYSAQEVGHYGLAAENYLHFTSPIRRYPDLLVHRLLKANWRRRGKGRPSHELEAETGKLEKLAEQSSERERAAMHVEREVLSFYSALMLEDRVGEEFDATVASLADFGFFVELDELHLEGLVKGETVEPRFRFDPLTYAMVFGSGRRVRVGAKVRVRLASVSVQRRQVDFEVVRFGEEPERVEPEAPQHRPGQGAPHRGGERGRGRGHRPPPPDGHREEPQRGAFPPPAEPRAPAHGKRHEEASGYRPPDGRHRHPPHGPGHEEPERGAHPPPHVPGREEPERGARPPPHAPGREEPGRGAHPPPHGPGHEEPERGAHPPPHGPGHEEPASPAQPSPHPGFDRLRALAARGASAAHPAGERKPQPRPGGQGDQRHAPKTDGKSKDSGRSGKHSGGGRFKGRRR